MGELSSYVNHNDNQSVALEEEKDAGFFETSWAYTKFAFSFPLFRTYLILFILTNSSLVLMGTMINQIVNKMGQPPVG